MKTPTAKPRAARKSASNGPLSGDEIKSLATTLSEALSDEADAFSLVRFCRRHGISVQMFYKLSSRGLAPRTFNVGTRVLVSREAAAEWRRDREAASAAASSPNA